MSGELDDFVVAHLHEVHTELQGIAARLEEHNRRFDRIDQRLDDFHPIVEHTLGLATMSQIKASHLEARHDAIEAWRKRVDERLDQIERRVAKVEVKVDN